MQKSIARWASMQPFSKVVLSTNCLTISSISLKETGLQNQVWLSTRVKSTLSSITPNDNYQPSHMVPCCPLEWFRNATQLIHIKSVMVLGEPEDFSYIRWVGKLLSQSSEGQGSSSCSADVLPDIFSQDSFSFSLKVKSCDLQMSTAFCYKLTTLTKNSPFILWN